MANLWTRIFTAMRGEFIGADAFGNRYYRERRAQDRRARRWVIFKGEADPTNIPAEWHGWLHHTTDAAPQGGGVPQRPWQKPHRANPTGSDQAYRPPGHLMAGGRRDRATGDYEPWTPG